MNKIFKCLVLTVGLLIGFTVNANAVSAATLTKVDSEYFYDRARGDGSDRHSWYFRYYSIDGEVSYCIEPNTPEGVHYPIGSWEDTGLPNSIKERITLIAYYGYTYPGHQTVQYRAATQGMLWDTIVGHGSNTTFWTERWGKGTQFNVSAEKAEIERLISTHYIRPSFNTGVYKAQVGETITLTDKNNVLNEYSISVSGAEYSVNGNTLSIKPIRDGAIDLTLTKKMPYSSAYKLFVGDGIQNMIVPGTVDPVIAKIRVNSYKTPVEGFKTDKETGKKPQGQATLKGAEYGVYETSTGKLVTTVVTDENGYFKSDAVLVWGDYYLQEIKPSEGYELDKTRYNFDTKGKELVRVDVIEQVIKNYVSILKQYEFIDGNTEFLNAEKGIQFEIYFPNGELFDTITTDKNGYATINLPYGVWKFHQVNTTTGYEKIYDFYITVNENSEKEQYYNILNNSVSAYLQVIKVDAETGKTIAIADTTFKILNTDTNQYVSQFVGGKVISEFKTDENGILVAPLKLQAGNYKLIEVSSPQGYLIDKNGLIFTIGNDTHYAYTTYGPFITVRYKNTPIKGQIEIHKKGEEIVIEDGKFTYIDKELSNVTFEIYAEEDIKSADGNHIYYNKGDLVDTITTDKNGYAISKKLPLGKYYFVEVKTQDDYILDDKHHSFVLKEMDNETPTVYESYSALNYLKKGTIEFTKTDLIKGEVIPNTIIEIYTEKDELIFTGKTDENGQIIIPELRYGKYYIIETNAPEGYMLNPERMYFEILEDGEIIKATMVDEKVIIEVPNTGIIDSYIIEMIGSLLVVGGIGVIVYVKKKKSKQQ